MLRLVRLPPRGAVEEEGVLRSVARALQAGALAVYPTETVYGIGTALSVGEAGVERVRAAKDSPPGRPFLLVAPSVERAFSLWSEVPEAARAAAERFWPGPLTLIGPARPGLPAGLLGEADGRPTLSVRVPGDPRLLRLLELLDDALVSTSANPAGRPPPVRFEELELDSLRPDLAVDGGPCTGGTPSTLLDLTGDEPRVLREGAVPASELL